MDSTDLHLCPDTGATYVPAGKQTKVDSPGKENPWYALFGSLNYPQGEGSYTIHERKRHQEVQTHLKYLIDSHPETYLFVVMDNASAHTTPQLDEFWETYRHRIEPVWLPTYSPHLNLIEKLWWYLRKQVTKNYFYSNLDQMAIAVIEWLNLLPIERFCSLMGIKDG